MQRVMNDYNIEGRSFLPSYELAPPPPPPPSAISLFVSFPVSPVELNDGWKGGGGVGAKSYDGEKAWSLINLSILLGYCPLTHTHRKCMKTHGQRFEMFVAYFWIQRSITFIRIRVYIVKIVCDMDQSHRALWI
jgi:hypothetical protein